jgi:hypothetical protein
MEFSECSRPAPAGTCFITRYRTPSLPPFLSLFLYGVTWDKILEDNESSEMGRLAMELSIANDNAPVVRYKGKTFVSISELSTVDTGRKNVTILPHGVVRMSTLGSDEKRAIIRLAVAAVKNSAAQAGFITGISNFVLSPRFRVEDENHIVGLQSGVVFSLVADSTNALILDCDMKSKIMMQESIASRMKRDREFNPKGLVVSSLSSVESMVVERVTGDLVSSKNSGLGTSIFSYNKKRGNYGGLGKVSRDSPVVTCSVGDAPRHYDYDSQLLYETLDFKGVKKLDIDFAAKVSDLTKMDMAERKSFCTFFVKKLKNDLLPDWLSFSTSPEVDGVENNYSVLDVALPSENLVFGKGKRHSSVEKGIISHGLFSLPPVIRLGILIPEDDGLDSKQSGYDYESFAGSLIDNMTTMAGASSELFQIAWKGTYHMNNPFKIRKAIDDYAKSSSDIALVFLPPRGDRTPYVMLKSELSRTRCASQMIHCGGNLSQSQVVNLLTGITAKVGNSENWQIDKLLWAPDLFVGLTASSATDNRQVVVATAFDSKGKALDVTVEIFDNMVPIGKHGLPSRGQGAATRGQDSVISEARLLHLLEGALLGYRSKVGTLPKSVVIHRDGEFPECNYSRVWQHFDELGVKCTLVEVDTGLPPRIGMNTGDSTVSPSPGTLFLTSDSEGLLISTQPWEKGSPLPVAFARIGGTTDIVAIGHQLFWLSRAHMGSVLPSRLPVTIHFARKVSAMALQGVIPQGTMGSRLLFI